MPSIRSLAVAAAASASLAFAAPSVAPVIDAYGAATGAPYLNQLIQAKGKLWFGTATDIPGAEQSDKEYMTILNKTQIFGQLTPANSMKYEQTEPEPGVFDFSGGDEVLAIAEQQGKLVRCHNLVWESELPDFINNGQWTNATLTAAMKRHIYTLVEHWGSRCYSWDVVNEAFNGDGTYADNIWYQHIGPAYVALAFKFAGEARAKAKAPHLKLFYNDYNLEFTSAKSEAVVSLIKNLTAMGIPIDGVGMESHFEIPYQPSILTLQQVMLSYTDLGMLVAFTELDVRFQNVSNLYAAGGTPQMQTEGFYNSVAACMSNDNCIGVTVWDYTDKYSWIESTFPGQGYACPYTANYTRQPAWGAMANAIAGKPCGKFCTQPIITSYGPVS